MQPVTPAGQTFVLLHPGYSTRRIATELQSAGVIRSADAFVVWHYLHHKRSLKAGEYLFDNSATAVDVHRRLVRGDVYFHTVVIPEGFNMFDIAQAIQNAGLGSSEDFLKVATSDTSLISDLAPDAKTLEGYLFPNTYEFTRMQTMEEMAAAMVKQFRLVAKEIGLTNDAKITDVKNSDLQNQANDVQQTVTLASIIEKETAAPEERPLVASVYYNRMAKHGASASRSQRDLCRTSAGNLQRRTSSCRYAVPFRLQHLHSRRTSAGADWQSRKDVARSGDASRRLPTISISSAMATAITASPRTWKSTIRTWQHIGKR